MFKSNKTVIIKFLIYSIIFSISFLFINKSLQAQEQVSPTPTKNPIGLTILGNSNPVPTGLTTLGNSNPQSGSPLPTQPTTQIPVPTGLPTLGDSNPSNGSPLPTQPTTQIPVPTELTTLGNSNPPSDSPLPTQLTTLGNSNPSNGSPLPTQLTTLGNSNPSNGSPLPTQLTTLGNSNPPSGSPLLTQPTTLTAPVGSAPVGAGPTSTSPPIPIAPHELPQPTSIPTNESSNATAPVSEIPTVIKHNENIPVSLPTTSFNKNIELEPTSFSVLNADVIQIIPLDSKDYKFAFVSTSSIDDKSYISFVINSNDTYKTTGTQLISNATAKATTSDLNNDGIPEVIIGNEIISADGSKIDSKNPDAHILVTGDFNNDAKNDFVLTDSFLSTLTNRVNFKERNSFNSELFVADLNGDGNTDILQPTKSNGKNILSISYGDENLGFTSKSIPINSKINSLALADLDGDSDIDIIIGSNKKALVLLNNNEGNSFTIKSYSVKGTLVEVGDVNLDGGVDLIVYSKDTPDFAVLKGKNGGTFDSPKYITTRAIKSLAIQDNAIIIATPSKSIQGTNITIYKSQTPTLD